MFGNHGNNQLADFVFPSMKKISLAVLLTTCTFLCFGQRYGTAFGLRMGTDWGFTLQQRVAKHLTFEGIVQSSLQREEVLLTGMVEKHNPILGRRLNLYFGGGLHKGWIGQDPETEETFQDPFGITLVGGVEFSLGRINIGYDFKPAINISGGEKGFYTQSGISVRYVLIKDKEWRKDKRKRKKKKKKRLRKKRRKKN